MPLLPKTPTPSASSSFPSPPSLPDNCVNTQKKLTRQRKIRHADPLEFGLSFTNDYSKSLPVSPDSARKDHGVPFSSAVPLPLPLPQPSSNKRPESSTSPEYGPARQSRSRIHHFASMSAKSSINFRKRFSQYYSNIKSINKHELRVNIPARSAPTSGFSSPAVSPQRSNTWSAIASKDNSSTNCSRVRNVESAAYRGKNCIASPRSAPTSPVVSPQRSKTGDFLTSSMAPQEFHHVRSAWEVPLHDLYRPAVAGYNSLVLPMNNAQSPDHSPFHSPTLQCHHSYVNIYSFPSHHKLSPGSSKVLPESSSSRGSPHPLPLPPGPTPSHSFMPSSHCTIEIPNVSPMKTQWLKGKLIGRGTFGSVYLGTNRVTGASCAMKEVCIIPDDPKSANCIKQLEQEIKVLRRLKHRNIVQYYGCDIVDNCLYIYLELVHPGSINKYVQEHDGQITESIVRNFTRHILSGLAYLHSTRTIHRDIKGANLLVDAAGVVKLADFGMAKHLTGLSYELSLNGSPHWMAPEVIQAVIKKDACSDLALAVDIWSLGCTIIEMYTGKPPWGELHGAQAMFKVLYKSPPIPETLSPEAKDFLSFCFRRNPSERPSAITLLGHPFVCNSNDLNVLACRQSLPAMNHDISHSPRDQAARGTDMMPSSPVTPGANSELTNSETSQQRAVKTFNHAAAPDYSPCTVPEVHPCTSTAQLVDGSHNFSSSHFSSNVLHGAVNSHLFAVK